MRIFNVKEIFQIAIRIEENGERFYHNALKLTEDIAIKGIFGLLAEEEMKHKEIFTTLLSEVTKDINFDAYPDEYLDYLQAYVNNTIFKQKQIEEEMSKIKDVTSALDFAIQRELDSILYYQEIKRFIPENQHDKLEGIVNEERKHYKELTGIKEGLEE